MNSIIDALGQETMMYWGVSYGSLLGQVYATLFPERSERIVLDAVMDQFDQFQDTMDKSHFVGNDVVVDGFFDECVRAGRACPLSEFGRTKSKLRENITDVINSLRSKPASVYINGSVYGVVDDYDVWINGIFPELYAPARWPALARRLADLQTGNATSVYMAYVYGRPSDGIPVPNIAVMMNDGRSGPKYWPQSRFSLLERLLPFFDKYRFAVSDMANYYIKQKWSIPTTHSYTPKTRVETAHPLLLLSTMHDPVCPYATAQEAQRVFAGSRLVSIQAYGHSSLARPSLCAAKYLRKYLADGSLPEKNVKCESDDPYFPSKDGDESAEDGRLYTEEEHSIRSAQRALAEDFGRFL
ncbi:hypothetical protein NQ176_g10214 [Zarea fungicola]|uniref:Uncharacterized protein n=1 Tax=Zarea fungicola TaxID=93591 RepID=A0ACC1MI13_9HYPO|nr:hypothetical protein NQ176_g10214 [Lecanicillium fungicola]